ncbi:MULTISPECIES: BMP family ABC transporter substrate-binding protein [unclassified Paenibacillus]|uniref:BMP family lipoprotein n=1 Tax=unclassified Paenibacillus TaxID=185978 RepID=UPI002406FE56|nr:MULTISPECIES: BMP family ABC transporter substrate-binding protein [unclassified Paenibacillus]MDF9843800.1 basic membrane protein A [Paenibacillus sp. PastF-2]MDF9850361.1 basic membrane protein A [Paenibacillus sp. PastM-2]MDF9856936.1 basic membrane protein A [Paenibacillus sp. PastF-1]MDH6482207.1 basic membrane protein A [Paenibacillus sp. PastH-2]MDH6509629.1 basic membrane protein A [Paenibacillus sp. PastM-3]
MRKVRGTMLFLMTLVLLAAMIGCSSNSGGGSASASENGASTSEGAASEDSAKDFKVGLLTGVAGLGDRSFNDLANEGALKAEEELGIELKVVEPGELAAAEGLLRDLANAGNELIIAVGFDMVEPLTVVAGEFPDKEFAVIDATIDLPNVRSLVFKEHEASFLVGALAAMMSETKQIGAVPAMDVPFLNRFTKAYEQGAQYIDPSVKVSIQPIASDSTGFNDPGKMKNIALSMYDQGIDVIYPVAGGSGTGLFEAAKEQNKYAFGVNSDQDYMAEGLVLASMMKRVDVAVFDTIKSFTEDKFEPGIMEYGLANEGVGLSEMKYTKDLIGEEKIAKLEELKQEIIDGNIKVIDVTAQ